MFRAIAATPWANNTIRNDIFTYLFSLMMFLDHENMGIDTNFITKRGETTILFLWLFNIFAVMAVTY